MSLTFLGKGSEFNVIDGNTSAYLQQGDSLFLIDCGSDVYAKLKQAIFFAGLLEVHVLITHVHPDHIGSLASLVNDLYLNKAVKVNIATPDVVAVTNILACMGVKSEYYTIQKLNVGAYNVIVNKDLDNIVIKPYVVNHEQNVNSYAYMILNGGLVLYFSGECNNVPTDVLTDLLAGQIDKFYQEVVSVDEPNNTHMSFTKLQELIVPADARLKVYAMNYDSALNLTDVTDAGFSIV